MLISIYTHEVLNVNGKVICVQPVASVEHSPREGFDHEIMRQLENELQELVTRRLNEALEKGRDRQGASS